MDFPDFDIELTTRQGPQRVRLTSRFLHLLWGAGRGPQTAFDLAAANRDLIEELVSMKLMAGQIEDGVVVVREEDYEG